MDVDDDARETPDAGERGSGIAIPGTQTLVRGLDVMDLLRHGPIRLRDVSAHLGLSRPTTQRLVAALTDRGYIASWSQGILTLGPKLLQLGAAASNSINLQAMARPHMERLSNDTGLCAFLGIRDGDQSLHLARVSGRQRLMVATKPGDRRPIAETGLGKALLLDENVDRLKELYAASCPRGGAKAASAWIAAMTQNSRNGYVAHESVPEEAIRSVAAPIRDANRHIIAAISVATAAQYLGEDRTDEIARAVVRAAEALSSDLGA